MSHFQLYHAPAKQELGEQLSDPGRVRYFPPAGASSVDPVDLLAIVGQLRRVEAVREFGIVIEMRRTLILDTDSESPYYCGRSSFETRGRFEIDGEDYVIESTIRDDGTRAHFDLRRHAVSNTTREGYYRER